MRNLKRALSLTLASVMLLGMMVVGSSAAAGYDDVADTDNVEAIEVLQAIEVMVGDERGFGPERPVNRAEMAVVMGKLLNLDYNYYDAICPFNDVYDWARGWVGACYANGIVSGRGEGVYDPGTTVTAVEAASMLMRALGYFKYQSDYADGFEVATVRQAKTIGLFDGVNSNTNEPLTRNQVAQMALNALQSGMVTADGNALNFIDGNGNVIATGGKVNYVYVTSNKNFATAISSVKASSMGSSNDAPIVELGEQLYDGKLKLRDALDVFGRPARRWEFNGKEVGAYAKKELLVQEYVGKVTGKDLYDLLGAENLDEYNLTVTVDGVSDPKIVDEVKLDGNRNTSIVFNRADLNRNNKAAVGATGTGVKTEVFVDHETDRIYIAIINTYLAIADKDYDSKKEETPLSVYGVKAAPTSKEYVKLKGSDVTIKLGIEDFALVEDMKKDDSFLVTIADQNIQTIQSAEVLSGSTISAFKLDDHVVSGGTTYNYTTTATFDADSLKIYTGGDTTNLKDRTYDIYLDAYGNLIGLKEIEATKNYVFITGLDRNSSNMVNRIADANAIFLDGTSDTIQVNMNKSTWHTDFTNQNTEGEALLNTWCTYTKSGDIYTVKEVVSTGKSGDEVPANAPVKDNKNNTTGLAQFHQTGKTATNGIDDEFTIDLKRLRLEGGGLDNSSFKYVYGDSDSVYLTAGMGELRSGDTDGSYGIIKEAATVATGILDTSITVWNSEGAMKAANDENDVKTQEVKQPERVAQGVYTLYDDDGTIIAVMAVGEGSAAKDLVYVHTDVMDLESDNGGSNKAANDGLWTWTRRVIRDGQEVTLTEVGDEAEYINAKDMLQYHWYEVRTDGEGNVIKANEAEKALGLAESAADKNIGRDAFVINYKVLNDIVELDGVDTVLFQSNGGPISGKDFSNGYTTDLLVKGNNTLAVDTLQGSGIHFRNDVNVVLQYWNRNTKEIDIMAGEGVDDLKDMVSIVNDNNDYADRASNTYYLSALIENGLATDIVIFDSYNTYNNGWIGYGNVTISFEYADYPITRYDFTVNGSDPLTREDFSQTGGTWTLNVKTNDRVDIAMKTATAETFGRQGDELRVSEYLKNGNYLTGTVRSGGYSVRIIPEAAGDYNLLSTFVPNDTHRVTVNHYVDGKVVDTDYSYVAMNKEVEISVVREGCKLVSVEANDTDVTKEVADGVYTFIMKDYNVVVDVYFETEEEPPVPGEPVAVALPAAGYVNIYRDGSSISKVEGGKVAIEDIYVDDVITLEPADALEFTAGVDAEGKVTGDITIAAKTGYNWNALFHMWMDPTGKGVPCTWITGAAVYSIPGARFSLARAVGDEIDVSEPNWVSKYVADEDAYFDITVDIGGGKTVTWNCHFMDMVPVMTFAEEYSDADQAAAWEVMADEAQIGTGIKVFEGEAGEEPVPPTPGEDVELKELESNAAKTVYTVNYHTDAKKPSAADIAAKIGTDTGYTIVGWRTGTNNGVLDATDANGKAVSVVVKWVAKTAIHYNGVIIAYVNKDDATKAAVGAGIFTADTQVIESADASEVAGTLVIPTKSNGKDVIVPSAPDTVDDWYFLDAYKVTVTSPVGGFGYKAGNRVVDVSGGAGIAADEVTFVVTDDVVPTAGSEYHLRVDGVPVVKKIATAADTSALVYETTVKKSDVKNGEVKIGAFGPIYTVALNDKTEKYYGADTEVVKISLPEGTSYIKANSATGVPQWFDAAGNEVTANEDGVLAYTVGAADIDVTNGKTITLNRAYKLEYDPAVIGNVAVLETSDGYGGTGSVVSGSYIAAGAAVCLQSVDPDVTLSGANGLTLTEVESLRTTGADGKITYYYTFTMPERNVVKADIVEGDNHGKVKVVVGTVTPGTLNAADGNGAGTAVVTITNGPDTKDFPGTIAWYTDAKCTKPVTGNGGRPAGMTDCYAETTATDGEWTVHFLAEGLEPVKAGTYYFKVTVSNVSAIGKLVVADYAPATIADAEALQDILDMDGITKFTLSAAVTGGDKDVTIPAGKTLIMTGSTNILTTSGTVTVEAGATLELDDAAQVTNLTGKVKLNDGKLVINKTLATLPNLAKGSTGEIELKGTTANTDVWAKRDMLVDSAVLAAKAADGKILVTSANVTVSDITLSGDGEVSWAGEDQSVSDIIKAQGGGDCLRVFDFNIGKGWQTKKLTVQIEDYAGVKHDLTEVASIPDGNATEDLHLKVLLGSNVKSITFTVDPGGTPSIGTYEIINSGIRP